MENELTLHKLNDDVLEYILSYLRMEDLELASEISPIFKKIIQERKWNFVDRYLRSTENLQENKCSPTPYSLHPNLSPKPFLNILRHHRFELSGNCRPAKRRGFLPVDEHRRGWRFARARQRDADIGVF